MRRILNIIPRPWLILMSIWFRPLIKWYYKGSKFTDPIDGSSYRKFLPYGYHTSRANALCPGTLSLERHRLLWLYLKRKTTFLKDAVKKNTLLFMEHDPYHELISLKDTEKGVRMDEHFRLDAYFS